MDEIYTRIWSLAKPLYEEGRPMDVEHIEWMMESALLVCEKEKKKNIDDSLLLPLVILHDVGYSEAPEGNPFDLDIRRAHMRDGGKIAREILQDVNYPKDKAEKIIYYVSIHDIWAFGSHRIYKKDKVLGVFNDLDYTWMATPKGFREAMKTLKKSHRGMLEYLENNEKLTNRPFSAKTTKDLYEKYLRERRREVLSV